MRDVFLMNVMITDAGLGYLCQLPLERLHVEGSRITDAGLQQLQRCQGLLILAIDRTAITDAGLERIAILPALRWLGLRDTRITERSVETLAGMQALGNLYLSDPPISQAGCEKLRALLPKCKIELSRGNPSAVASSAPAMLAPLNNPNRPPVPSASELQTAKGAVKEVFGEELAQAKKPEDKGPLAEKLFKKAQESGDDPAAAYALLDLARSLAADGAEAALLAKIDAELGSRFDVQPLELLAEDLEKAGQKAHPPAAFRAVAEMALDQVDDALAVDNFALAKRLSDAALAAARKAKDPLVLKWSQERNKSLSAAKQQWDAAEAAKAALAATPDDPDANLALGRYLCFVKGDWAAGCAHLAQGSDAALKELGAKSAVEPQDAAAQAVLGEAWAEAADAVKGKGKADLQAGARYWLAKALPASTGLTKAKVEQRLKQLEPTSGSTANRPARKPSAGTPNQQLARDRAAAEWALGIRGKIGIMAPSFSGEQSIELLADLPKQPFALVRVDFSKNAQVSNDELKHLEGLINLATLELEASSIGDEGLVHIKDLINLTHLSLATTQITDAGLVNLRGLTNLRELWITNRPRITGAGLQTLKDMKHLRVLRLGNTGLDDAGIEIFKNFSQLERLRLNRTPIT
ncbi:MAG TPA: hypothetical protein VHY20_15995, partial [Pirellulales bacterium]|nr:hypothetical protein [Pirellulales bacterium]